MSSAPTLTNSTDQPIANELLHDEDWRAVVSFKFDEIESETMDEMVDLGYEFGKFANNKLEAQAELIHRMMIRLTRSYANNELEESEYARMCYLVYRRIL